MLEVFKGDNILFIFYLIHYFARTHNQPKSLLPPLWPLRCNVKFLGDRMSVNRIKTIFVLSFAALSLVACGSNTVTTSKKRSSSLIQQQEEKTNLIQMKACQIASEGVCTDYSGSGWSPAEIANAAADECAAIGGEPLAEPCPSTDRIGTCAYQGGLDFETQTRFYSPVHSLENIMNSDIGCEDQGGTWSAE